MTASPPPPVPPLVRALRDVREILERARRTGDRREIEMAIERINFELDEGDDTIRATLEMDRGYADYFGWPPDRRIEELEIARILCSHLSTVDGLRFGQPTNFENDPPDVVVMTSDGERIAIEVTELVDGKAIEKNAHSRKHDQRPLLVHSNWAVVRLVEELERRIVDKDAKLKKAKRCFDKVILAIFTDEPLIDEQLAREAAIACAPDAENIHAAYLILSYQPNTNRNAFPNGYPVFQILEN